MSQRLEDNSDFKKKKTQCDIIAYKAKVSRGKNKYYIFTLLATWKLFQQKWYPCSRAACSSKVTSW